MDWSDIYQNKAKWLMHVTSMYVRMSEPLKIRTVECVSGTRSIYEYVWWVGLDELVHGSG